MSQQCTVLAQPVEPAGIRDVSIVWDREKYCRQGELVDNSDSEGGMWFKDLFGFHEESPEKVRENMRVIEGQSIVSLVTNARYQCGSLEIQSLYKLRERLRPYEGEGHLVMEEIVADIRDIHCNPQYDGCVIQVASQFNVLEMVGPTITPEQGVDIYENDRTQGPICAIACGAGTVYRNYFYHFENGHIGQTRDRQIDCLDDIGVLLGNDTENLWEMVNGYMIADSDGLQRVNAKLAAMTRERREDLQSRLKVGIQRDTEVTLESCGNIITQVYCSALPIAYCRAAVEEWEPMARLVLEAAYEATFAIAAEKVHLSTTGEVRPKLFLTLLGCGAFGNPEEWAISAIHRAAQIHKNYPLDVFIVRYG